MYKKRIEVIMGVSSLNARDAWRWRVSLSNVNEVFFFVANSESISEFARLFRPIVRQIAGSVVLFSGEDEEGKEVKALLKVKEETHKEGGEITIKCSKKVKTHGTKANALKEANNEITNGEWGNVSLTPVGVEEELYVIKANNIFRDETGVFILKNKKNLVTKLKMTSENIVESVNNADVCFYVGGIRRCIHFTGGVFVGSVDEAEAVDYALDIGGSGNVMVQFEYSDGVNGGVKLKTDSIKGDKALNAALKSGSDVVITLVPPSRP